MNTYQQVMDRKNDIMKKAVSIDYSKFEKGVIAFDYNALMDAVPYTLEEIAKIQQEYAVGNTPLIELRNITRLARQCSKKGYGARIVIKDEASNASGSFKARRASLSVYQAEKLGYKGVISATSGNYGAAVASQAAMHNLDCIIVQECYDSKKIGQPEIIEKARKCEALGAEVIQLTVGPELFFEFLQMLEETGYFNASLYTPFSIAGIETLGAEIASQTMAKFGKHPDVVVCTNAGGGNLTGTARGLKKANCNSKICAASVDLSGLHMASDTQFNKKSFTTGHTGFGIPFTTMPDRSDVPRSAARPLRYMDRYLTVTQGEVFYMTEALANVEGLEKGPAGNVALAAAFSIAQELPEDAIVLVQETEYTGAGKHLQPQLSFARDNGIDIHFGSPKDEIAGKNIILPSHPSLIKAVDVDLTNLRKSNIKNAIKNAHEKLTKIDIDYLIEETNSSRQFVIDTILEINKELL
ncbi:MAG: 2-amino-4-oxopentanoate thiolase subunit OrtB [Clostridia bacterium]